MNIPEIEEITKNSVGKNDNVCGVYFLIRDGVIVYIGKSSNIFNRINAHRSSEIDFDSYYMIQLPLNTIDISEQELISKFKPEHNTTSVRNKKEDVYEFIVRYKQENDGCSPSFRTICDATGIRSAQLVKYELNRLRRNGLITQDGRVIKITGAKWIRPDTS